MRLVSLEMMMMMMHDSVGSIHRITVKMHVYDALTASTIATTMAESVRAVDVNAVVIVE
jgi:hypothetical protein